TGGKPGAPKDSDELLGAPGGSSIHGDALATKVLAKGETMAGPTGRADNFSWGANNAANAAQSAPAAPVAAEPKAEPRGAPTGGAALASAPADLKQEDHKKGTGKSTQRATKKAKHEEATASSSGSSPTSSSASTSTAKPPRDGIPRPPKPIDASNGSSNGSRNGSRQLFHDVIYSPGGKPSSDANHLPPPLMRTLLFLSLFASPVSSRAPLS